MDKNIFITGMGRSGTTLLEKLMSSHTDMDVISQPFPLIFIKIKKLFLESIGIDKYYVLNDDKESRLYPQETFDNFLESITLSQEYLLDILKEMETYSGQYTKPYSLINQETTKILTGFEQIYNKALSYFFLKEKRFTGSKETMCEEFIPYLTMHNFKCIVIIRDPRDVVSSINYPEKHNFFGDKKPTLFILRTWRKSFEYIYHFKSRELCFIRYEDLINSPYSTLSKITKFLNLPKFPDKCFENGIHDRVGNLWKSNSSFNNELSIISSNSMGNYKNKLSHDEINYIESVCYNEMEYLGYSLDTKPNRDIIGNFYDTNINYSKHLNKDFSSLNKNIEAEKQRFSRNR